MSAPVQLTINGGSVPAPQPGPGVDPDVAGQPLDVEFGPGTGTGPSGQPDAGQPGDGQPDLPATPPLHLSIGPSPAPAPGAPTGGGSSGSAPQPDGDGDGSSAGGSGTDKPAPRRPGHGAGGSSTNPRPGSDRAAGPRGSRGGTARRGVGRGSSARSSLLGQMVALPRRVRAVVVGPVAVPAGGLAAGPPRIGRSSARSGGAPLGGLWSWLVRAFRSGQGRASGFTPETWRVIAILAVGALVTLASQIDLNAPAPVEAPDAISTATANAGAPSAAPTGGGMVDDPTSKGRITAVTAHGLAEIRNHFPAVRSAACWDKHAWNPTSDHPLGKACDVYVSPAGKFAAKADPAGFAQGNQLVAWLIANAGTLDVNYVIWQGRIWSQAKGDHAYNGGGVYDPTDPVGGHFDHIHVSFRH